MPPFSDPVEDFPGLAAGPDGAWDDPVGRCEAFARSEHFRRLFSEGMALLETSAGFLTGPGKVFSRTLPRLETLAYAAESARLTTRLMLAAAWLLVMRSVREQEMPASELLAPRHRINAPALLRQVPREFGGDPSATTFNGLVRDSLALLERITRCDDALTFPFPEASPVALQLRCLREKLGAADHAAQDGPAGQ